MDIRGAREAAGLTQAQLAAAAGVPQPNLSAYENGRRRPTADVLERIRRALVGRPSERVRLRREEIARLVEAHHARNARIVGSIARGQDGPDSDLDLLVEFTDEATLLDEVGLRLALVDLLRTDVDVIAVDALRGEVRRRLLAEAVPL